MLSFFVDWFYQYVFLLLSSCFAFLCCVLVIVFGKLFIKIIWGLLTILSSSREAVPLLLSRIWGHWQWGVILIQLKGCSFLKFPGDLKVCCGPCKGQFTATSSLAVILHCPSLKSEGCWVPSWVCPGLQLLAFQVNRAVPSTARPLGCCSLNS